MPDVKEQFLLFRIRAFRDERAFGVLVNQYKEEMYRFLRSRTASEEDAMDGASEVFFRVWNYLLTSHSNDQHFRGLIYHTARYWLGDYFRRKHNTVSLDELEEKGKSFSDKKESGDTILARADASLVRNTLDKLKPEYAEVISLRYFEGMELGEIAKRLEKTVNATRVTLHRALKELRTYL